MDTVNITVDWNSAKSIELAEQAKAKLENDGWSLVNSFGGMNSSILVYGKRS